MDKAAFGRETAADQSDVHLDAACWRGSAWGGNRRSKSNRNHALESLLKVLLGASTSERRIEQKGGNQFLAVGCRRQMAGTTS